MTDAQTNAATAISNASMTTGLVSMEPPANLSDFCITDREGYVLASYSAATGECRFDWPMIEQLAADDGGPAAGVARMLLAARKAGAA